MRWRQSSRRPHVVAAPGEECPAGRLQTTGGHGRRPLVPKVLPRAGQLERVVFPCSSSSNATWIRGNCFRARLRRVLAGVVALSPHLEGREGPVGDAVLVGEADARLACWRRALRNELAGPSFSRVTSATPSSMAVSSSARVADKLVHRGWGHHPSPPSPPPTLSTPDSQLAGAPHQAMSTLECAKGVNNHPVKEKAVQGRPMVSLVSPV